MNFVVVFHHLFYDMYTLLSLEEIWYLKNSDNSSEVIWRKHVGNIFCKMCSAFCIFETCVNFELLFQTSFVFFPFLSLYNLHSLVRFTMQFLICKTLFLHMILKCDKILCQCQLKMVLMCYRLTLCLRPINAEPNI